MPLPKTSARTGADAAWRMWKLRGGGPEPTARRARFVRRYAEVDGVAVIIIAERLRDRSPDRSIPNFYGILGVLPENQLNGQARHSKTINSIPSNVFQRD